MTDYAAPVRDMSFVIEELIGLDTVAALPGLDWVTGDLVRQVLAEAGKFGAEVLAPLNRVGDIEGCALRNGVVTTPEGFADAYRQFTAGGWNGTIAAPDHGGQGLPWLVATAIGEIWESANLAFSLCPMLTQSAIWALTIHGSPEQKDIWLPRLVSGEWSGTMNLTEPHAGSDVGALRTRAVREDGHYRIKGQKIFITWGEHDMAENIVHTVLARVDGAPEGTRGISLFIVPKYLVNADGSLGARNDLRCAALEHKLGIHASPTAVMSYGDDEGAVGYLVGEENRGMEYMFTMMNNARLGVGREGLAMAERAFQQARDYAAGRVQGRSIADPAAGPVAIVKHPDVRRMLMTMKAEIEAMRALAYAVAADLDVAGRHEDAGTRARRQARVDLLVPVVKAWCSDTGVAIASEAVQVHGGAGFIEETGAAQHYRDSRITPIYEGTNGIQALDLVRRKILGDRGAAVRDLMAEMDALARGTGSAATAPILDALAGGLAELGEATDWLLADRPAATAAAAATPYLALIGTVAGGWLLARSAAIADARAAEDGDPFYRAKVDTARFYAECVLPRAASLKRAAIGGAALLDGFDEQRLWH
ncbi:MAG: acyl-CoA dehydrogenase [Defluviicoccus sp.]|nr:acyl-CoA dehydrogenase [Defluviicoccus sp.]